MKKLAEGVYADGGTLHLDLPEMCRAVGVEPTQENQDRLQAAAIAMFEASPTEVEVEVRDGEGSGRWRASWTHPICEPCWTAREGTREPVRIKEPPVEVCCFCGRRTLAGIYVREAPEVCLTGGRHE